MGRGWSNEEMKQYLIEYQDVSRVVHSTHRTSYTTPIASAIQPTKKKEVQYVALRAKEQTTHHFVDETGITNDGIEWENQAIAPTHILSS